MNSSMTFVINHLGKKVMSRFSLKQFNLGLGL